MEYENEPEQGLTRQQVGETLDSLRRQEGGDHYRKYAIQPVEYSIANNLSFCAGNVVKYVTRYKDKHGAEDIRKAMHYLEMILEFEYPAAQEAPGAAIGKEPPPPYPNVYPADQTNRVNTGPALILKLDSEDPDHIGRAESI